MAKRALQNLHSPHRMLALATLVSAAAITVACGGTETPRSAAIASPNVSPSPAAIALPAAATLSAPTRDVVWALVMDQNQYLFRSSDRGQTWTQRPLPAFAGQNVEISFVSASEGWLKATGSPETQCNAQSVSIWHTTDAGATWEELGAKGIADAQCKTGFSFTDSTHGFIGAWDQNDRPVIYFTGDSGRSWKGSRPLSDPPGFTSQQAGGELTAGRVRAFGNVLLVPVFAYLSGALVQFVYVSNDGGATWRYDATAGSGGGGTLAFVTASHWLQQILPGQSLETIDGGRTWQVSSSDYSQAAPVAPEVIFADDEVGYATVRGAIQITVDGGRHWTYISTPGT